MPEPNNNPKNPNSEPDKVRSNYMGFVSRRSAIDKSVINETERSVRCVLATETPSLVWDWESWGVIREILMVEPGSVMQPENDKVVMLDSHSYRGGVATVVKGSVRNLQVENGEYVGRAIFSSLSEEEWTLVQEGHLDAVSVGYETYNESTIILKPGGSYQHGSRIFKNDFADQRDLYIRLKWRPLEGSMVPIGADSRSGFRNDNSVISFIQKQLEEQNRKIAELENRSFNQTEPITIRQENTMPEPNTTDQQNNQDTRENILKQDAERRKEIRATAKRLQGRIKDVEQLADQADLEGWSLERFNGEIVSRMNSGEEFGTPKSHLDMDEKQRKQYNMWNLVRSVAENNPKLAGLEIEASNTIAQRLGLAPRERGFFIPYEHLKREITIGTMEGGTGTAGALVATQLMTGNFMDLLYNTMVIGRGLNVKYINGLVGDLEFSKKTSSSTGYYVGESEAAAESDVNFGTDKMSPKTASGLVKVSRRSSMQTTPDMEILLIADIINQLNLRVDKSAIQGQGVKELVGLLYSDGVQIIDGLNFTEGTAIDMETALEIMNVNLDNAAWLTTPTIKGALRKRKIEPGQTDKLWVKNEMLGRRGLATNQVPDGTLALVDPTEMIMATWGVLEIQINRLNDDGGVKIIPFWDHDFLNRRGTSTIKVTNFS
ncbi:MAG TPA: phage major capsid protein [Ignavibacteriales bacterium]|nr:phage major capsid protein [Ignavibacteriales bacterium]